MVCMSNVAVQLGVGRQHAELLALLLADRGDRADQLVLDRNALDR